MPHDDEPIPGITDDPVFRLIYSGQARTLDEAEEMVLEASWPELIALLESPLSNKELEAHPLIELVRQRGTRGWEDSLL